MNLPARMPFLEDCRSYTKAATMAGAGFHAQDGISAKQLKILWEEECPPLSFWCWELSLHPLFFLRAEEFPMERC